jgi:ABC-2 type transport system ATP-binding protein
LKIELQGITKRYGEVVAVDDFAFSVEHNTIAGLIGPNAAGKTTTLKMISGLVKPTKGTILYDGKTEKPPIVYHWPWASWGWVANLGRFLETYTMYYGYSRTEAKERVRWLAEKFSFTDYLDKYDWVLSFGTRTKVLVAMSFIPDADLYCLDEPFPGLDPYTRRSTANMIKELRDKGKTIIVSSHVLGEIENLCDRVIIINKGKFVSMGPPLLLKQATKKRILELVVRGELPENVADQLKGVSPQISTHEDATEVRADVPESFSLQNLLKMVSEEKTLSVTLRLPTLEEMISELAEVKEAST